MSYNFGRGSKTGVGRKSGDRELVGGGYRREDEIRRDRDMKKYEIIRLVCIDRYGGFKYRRFGQQGGSG